MSQKKRFRIPSIHIKSNTKGTSNELSFSVLEAARGSKNKTNQDSPSVGEVDLYTVPGHKGRPKGAPTKNESLLYQSESLARHHKKAKQTWKSKPATMDKGPSAWFRGIDSKWVSIGIKAVLAVLAIALVVFLGYLITRFFQGETLEQTYHRNQLDAAIIAVSETDEAFEALQVLADDLLGSHPDEEKIITEQRSKVSDTLTSVEAQARDASQNLKDREDQQAAGNVVSSITSRAALWNAGLKLIDEAAAAKAAKVSMDEGWKLTLEGDGLLKNAAAEILGATKESIETAQNSTMAARSAFEQAKACFMEVQNIYPAYDAKLFVDYAAKRLEACDYAIASNQALLDHDTDRAQEQNEAYNKTDAEAVLLVDEFPKDPVSDIDEVFANSIEQNKKIYQTTLSQTENTDAFIRDYLGADKK